MYDILPAHKNLIKEMLVDNKPRVYSLIIKFHFKELLELGPTVFRKWLATELEIPEAWINVSSLNSALVRFRKSIEKTALADKNPLNET